MALTPEHELEMSEKTSGENGEDCQRGLGDEAADQAGVAPKLTFSGLQRNGLFR